MRSPFPGMDPYLEQFWGDLHQTMINRSRASIQKQLPADLVARVDERVVVEPADPLSRKIIPDVRVVERGLREQPVLRTSNGIAVAEPLVVHIVQDEPERQGFIEIIDLGSGRRVITIIEVLSPSNKLPGTGRDLYLRKQEELRQGGVSLVEINLNRTGSHVFMVPLDRIPEGQATPYAACIRRAWKPFDVEYYRFPMRKHCPPSPSPYGPTIPTSHSTFKRYWTSAARRDVTSTTSTTTKTPTHRSPATTPAGQTLYSANKAIDSLRDLPRLMIRAISTKVTEMRLPG